ncbi:MAG: hypothetical protein ACD_79C00282G0001 [uncultured bacterium]|nr:MAG: hypothetical protein ACD_79C00282G0001 [uncultured bacterium]
MGIESGLRLLQLQVLEPKNSVEFYNRNFEIKEETLGIKYNYVLCPQTALKDFSQSEGLNTNNQLGICIKDDEKKIVFVSKNLHFAQIPIVGLLLHLNGLDKKELAQIIQNGEELLKNKNPDEISLITCCAVFDHAESMLRSEEFNDLVEKFRNNEQFSPRVRKKACEHIIETKHNNIEKNSNALPVLQEKLKTREEYYRIQLQRYNHAFEQNQWTEKSRSYTTVIEQTYSSRLKQDLRSFTTHSEEISQEITEKYGDNLHNIVAFLDCLVENLNQKGSVDVEKDAEPLIYIIQQHFTDVLGKKPPMKFRGATNIVEKGFYLERFYQGLRNRLVSSMFKEMKKIQGILKRMPELTAEMASNRQFGDVAREYVDRLLAPLNQDNIPRQFLLIPVNDISTIIEKQFVKYLDTLTQIATKQPKNDIELLSLLEARKIMEDAGASTESIDNIIYERIEKTERKALNSG